MHADAMRRVPVKHKTRDPLLLRLECCRSIRSCFSQATELLTRGSAVPAAHADAMRRVAEADVVAACLAGVKVSVPGLQAAKAAAKKGRKAKGQ